MRLDLPSIQICTNDNLMLLFSVEKKESCVRLLRRLPLSKKKIENKPKLNETSKNTFFLNTFTHQTTLSFLNQHNKPL